MDERIETLKRELTDKHIVVIGGRPELARFEGRVGQIKTVNMSGRALVQFDAWNNTGWFDIDPEFLRIVAAPEPAAKPAKTVTATQPATAKPDAPARQPIAAPASGDQPAPASVRPAAPKKLSTAEILAAARAKREAAGASGSPKSSGSLKTVTHEAGHEPPVVKPADEPAAQPGETPPLGEVAPAEAKAGDPEPPAHPTPATADKPAKSLTTAEKIALLRKGKPPGA